MEKKWIQRAKKGDASSYEKAFALYEVDLYKLAYMYSGNREDALDIVQEVAYRSYKYIHTLKEVAYFKTWLIRILINCANDFVKKRPDILMLEEDIAVEDHQLEIDVKVTVEGILQALSKEEKDVILLKYYEDYTLQQIAETLDIKLSTAKTILYRALRKLKVALKKREDTYER